MVGFLWSVMLGHATRWLPFCSVLWLCFPSAPFVSNLVFIRKLKSSTGQVSVLDYNFLIFMRGASERMKVKGER